MRRTEDQTTKTVSVLPGASVEAALPQSGVLRFERQGGSMAGEATLSVEDGALAMHFADGASVYVKS